MTIRQWLQTLFHPHTLLPPLPPAPVPAPPAPVPAPSSSDFDATLLDLHNTYRASYDKPILRLNSRLTSSAQMWATWMATHHNQVHEAEGFTVQGRIETAGYTSWLNLAENIAEGYLTPQAVMVGWLKSPGHLANIVGPYVDVGFGRALDSFGSIYWCVDFGNPQLGFTGMRGMTIPHLSGPLKL